MKGMRGMRIGDWGLSKIYLYGRDFSAHLVPWITDATLALGKCLLSAAG